MQSTLELHDVSVLGAWVYSVRGRWAGTHHIVEIISCCLLQKRAGLIVALLPMVALLEVFKLLLSLPLEGDQVNGGQLRK